MNGFDQTKYWNDPSYTQERVAVVPGRMQPPHIGHINMVKNCSIRFSQVLVFLYDRPKSERDPFPFDLRQRWLLHAFDGVNNIAVVKVLGTLAEMITSERDNFMARITSRQPFTVVSNNPGIPVFASQFAWHFISPASQLDDLVGVPSSFREWTDSCGHFIRDSLSRGELPDPMFLPPSLSLEELRDAYCSEVSFSSVLYRENH